MCCLPLLFPTVNWTVLACRVVHHQPCVPHAHSIRQLAAHRNGGAHAASAWHTSPCGSHGSRGPPSPRARRGSAAPAPQAGRQGCSRACRGINAHLQTSARTRTRPGALSRRPQVPCRAATGMPLTARACSGCVPADRASGSPAEHAYRDPAAASARPAACRFAQWLVVVPYADGSPSIGRQIPRAPTRARYADASPGISAPRK